MAPLLRRGYVQLTGRANYARAKAELGVPLLADPDLAMQPDIAAKIMRRGMQGGWFTFDTYLPGEASREQFKDARRTINGLDGVLTSRLSGPTATAVASILALALA